MNPEDDASCLEAAAIVVIGSLIGWAIIAGLIWAAIRWAVR